MGVETFFKRVFSLGKGRVRIESLYEKVELVVKKEPSPEQVREQTLVMTSRVLLLLINQIEGCGVDDCAFISKVESYSEGRPFYQEGELIDSMAGNACKRAKECGIAPKEVTERTAKLFMQIRQEENPTKEKTLTDILAPIITKFYDQK